jgi:hypothetical protein
MEENTQVDGVNTSEGSAEGENNQAQPKTKQVRYEDHKRAIDDMIKFKARAQELEAKIQDFETKKLQESNDWKTLAEREKGLREEAQRKLEKHSSFYQSTQKHSAVLGHALKAGLKAEAEGDLELLSMDGVEVEVTSTGRFNVIGADTFVEELKRKKPHWFNTQKDLKVNTGGTSGFKGDVSNLSMDALNKLRKTDPAKYREGIQKLAESRAKKV